MNMTEAPDRIRSKFALPRVLGRRQLLVSSVSRRGRRIAALVLVGGFALLTVMVLRNRDIADWNPSGRLAWSVSLLAAVMLLARGIRLGRPVTGLHSAAALAMLSVGIAAHVVGLAAWGDVLVAGMGLVLMWPLPSRPWSDGPDLIWPLISATRGDPLAPFAMQSTKSLFFNSDRTAALAYRTLLGFAVVSGDPIGEPGKYRALVGDFATMCQSRGWRIMVLSCGQHRLNLWHDESVVHQSLMTIPIGRDVVVDVANFTMAGRRFRNLRQAVARTHNRGITTEVVGEQCLGEKLRAELTEVLLASRGGGRYERGFSMMLDGVLEGRYPGVMLIVGRDGGGRIQAFHRYVQSGAGSDVSLDLPWRRPRAPNGMDERLTVDMIRWCKARGARRISLAFAAFPELFNAMHRTVVQRGYYTLIRLGDPLIRLESLYRYLRKFHAFGRRRYVLVSARHLPAALIVLLSLEFVPHRAHRRWPHSRAATEQSTN